MRIRIFLLLIATVFASAGPAYSEMNEQADVEKKKDSLAGTIEGLKIDNIMTTDIVDFPESGLSDHQILSEIRACFRPRAEVGVTQQFADEPL